MKEFCKNWIGFLSILLIPVVSTGYGLLNNDGRTIHTLATPLDTHTPFIKIFIIPYILWYAFILICLFYFYLRNKQTYYISLTSLIVGELICYAIYYFFQTTTPRPVIDGNDLLSTLIRMIYRNDEPYNCFPSIHVFTTSIMLVGILKSSFRNYVNVLLISINSILIILSTIFIKQHVILDVVSGIGLACLTYPIFEIIYKKWAEKQRTIFATKYDQFKRVPEHVKSQVN